MKTAAKMVKVIYIFLLPAVLALMAHQPLDEPNKKCKISVSYNLKDSSVTYKTKVVDWAAIEKKIRLKDSSFCLYLSIVNGEVDNTDGIRFIFRDGTSLTRSDAPVTHKMGGAAGGGFIDHSTTFLLNENDLKQLKENLVLEFRIGKTAKKILSDKQALKLQEKLKCLLSIS